jgi:hypothetical protein
MQTPLRSKRNAILTNAIGFLSCNFSQETSPNSR